MRLLKSLLMIFAAGTICFAQLTPGLVYSPPANGTLPLFAAIQFGPSRYVDSVPNAYYILLSNGPGAGCFAGTDGFYSQQPHFLVFVEPIYDTYITIYYYASPSQNPGVDPYDAVRCNHYSATPAGVVIQSFLNSPALPSNNPQFSTLRANSDPYSVSAGISGPGSTEIQDFVTYTDPFFRLSNPVPFASDAPVTYVRTSQGGVVFDYYFNNPVGQASSSSFISAEYSGFAPDDYTGQNALIPTQGAPLISNAVNKKLPPPGENHTGAEFSSEGGEYRYTYHVDTRKLSAVYAGDTTSEASSAENPAGWISKGHVWIAGMKAERAADSKFSVVTSWRPGLIALLLRNHENLGAGIYDNSQARYAIGPAFAPDLDRTGILAIVKNWVLDYGFNFLKPLVDDPSMNLNDLKPGDTQIEQQIVDCLRAVLQ